LLGDSIEENDIKIGGPDVVVEIDETKISNRSLFEAPC
jgi:hypothetical protein